jgi:hypothetical protein
METNNEKKHGELPNDGPAPSLVKDSADDLEKYKYHQAQKKADNDGDQVGDKPKNHTTPGERMLNPDRGEG